MTGFVHALLGSALGRLTGSRAGAFGVGVLSHALGDVIPHREAPLPVDAALTAAALAVLAGRYGADSPELAGALGGIAPDLEHVPSLLGLKGEEGKIFPTHGDKQLLPHAGKPSHDLAQIAVGALALLSLVVVGGGSSRDDPESKRGCPPAVDGG